MSKIKIRRGVILAAGDGGRMGTLTHRFPKVLFPVKGKPLIFHPIESMLNAGIREIAIIVGYLNQKVETILKASELNANISFVYNPDYLGGNALSVNTAEQWAQGEPFVLCMGDHIIDPGFITHFLDRHNNDETLGIDYLPSDHHIIDEATKVSLYSDRKIKQIGKSLVEWDAIDTGVFLIHTNFLQTVRELIPHIGIHVEISDVIRMMIQKGLPFFTRDMSGMFWADVDTPDDLESVSGGV
jgi:choline kinase